ncbi:unnamed protein product [Peniophora sp. CBMAI 1063]|nr:unnamed protein product [Peniophora sp. CBMAI 1063]
MENFINIAKSALEGGNDNSSSNQGYGKTGGSEYNTPHHSGQFQGSGRPQLDEDAVASEAASQGSGDHSLFKSAMSFVSGNSQEHEQPVDEEHVQRAHAQAYQQDNAGGMDANSMGAAAALQALKMFTSGGGSSSGGGSGSTSSLISMAMAEASKLFDKSGGASGGDKQSVVNSAAMTVMKLVVQSKFSGTTGGSNSGGLGSLMSMASKFM